MVVKLKTEVWKCDDNKEEIHLFLPDKRNEYVIGYNPKLISTDKIAKLLDEQGFCFDAKNGVG